MCNWRRLATMAMTGVMVVGMLSGCVGNNTSTTKKTNGKETTSEDIKDYINASGDKAKQDGMETVSIHLPQISNFTYDGIQKVEEKLNEVMAKKYQVQVDLNYVALGNWTTQTNLALTTDECDIFAILNSPLSSYVSNGQLAPLTDYYANASEELKATFSDTEIAQTTFHGDIYSLPRKWWGGQETVLFMNEKICNEMGIDPQSIDSIEKVDQLLYEVHEKYPNIYALVPGVEPNKLMDLWYFGDGMADERGRYGVVPMFDADFDKNNIKTKSVFESDGFMKIASYAYKWYKDGLVLPDVLSNTIGGTTYIQNDQAFGFLVRQQGHGYKPTNSANNGTIASASLGPSVTYSNTFNVVSYGISANSKHKDAAFKVLQAIYTDEEVGNLITEGIENVDYKIKEDGTVTFPNGSMDPSTVGYGGLTQFWTYPNTMICHPSVIMGPDYKNQAKAYADACKLSPIIGFSWDYSKCEDEMTAVSKIYDQYYNALISGMLDPKKTIPQVIEELNRAGMKTIIKSQSEQLKKFMETK